MRRSFQARSLRAGPLLGLLAVAAVAVTLILIPSDRTASAQPAGALPPELRYVPADAAIFVHADAATLWGGPLGKSVRSADAKLFDGLAQQATAMFGVGPDALKTVTLFFPKVKGPRDTESFGAVFTFNRPFDKDKLRTGFAKLIGGEPKFILETPSDRTAVLLVGLDAEYAKPRPADEKGPLAAAIREAATGKHLVVAGTTLASLPDEIRGDNLPPEVRAFQPLFKSESMTAVVDHGKDLSVEVRVKAANANQAVEVEKAFGALAALIQEGIGMGLKELEKDAGKDPITKDVVALLKAAQDGVKDARYTTAGTESRVTVKLSGDLPIGRAVVGGIQKTRQAAARAQSSNNLKQIAIALHNYHDVHGAFPPAAVCDKRGKPMLSWRVLILPYIEQEALYRQFKLDEPWDSPNNKKLISKFPKTYANPSQDPKDAQEFKTQYRVFVGNGAMFDYLRGPKLQDITDGTSNTVMIATAAEAVPWTKPDELEFDPEKDLHKQLLFAPNDVCMISFADGSVRAVSKSVTRKTLNAAITKAGGEVFNFDDLP